MSNQIEVSYQLVYTDKHGYIKSLWFNAINMAQALQLVRIMYRPLNIASCTLIKDQYKIAVEAPTQTLKIVSVKAA